MAVVQGEAKLTYSQLNFSANRLAEKLLARGTGPGDIVPILLPRTLALAAAILGVLKTGAAYAIPDQSWSADRIGA